MHVFDQVARTYVHVHSARGYHALSLPSPLHTLSLPSPFPLPSMHSPFPLPSMHCHFYSIIPPQLADWWLHVAYLGFRLPVAIHSSPAIGYDKQHFKDTNAFLKYVRTYIRMYILTMNSCIIHKSTLLIIMRWGILGSPSNYVD